MNCKSLSNHDIQQQYMLTLSDPDYNLRTKRHFTLQIIKRPRVAGAVLETALSLFHSLTHGLWNYLYGAATP